MIRKALLTVVAVAMLYSLSFAAGGHEGLTCTGCHDIHAAKDSIIFAVEANKAALGKNRKPFTGVTALCLGCHAEPENGGMGIKPISQHTTHPFGDEPNARIARVPRALLRDGRMDCVSCHDPHPSNPNYRYLRVDTKGGGEMQSFCAMCHPAKADAAIAKKATKTSEIFTSMDESKGATSVSINDLTSPSQLSGGAEAPAATPAAAPAAPKK